MVDVRSLRPTISARALRPRRYCFESAEHDHIELLDRLNTLACHVILSGYPLAPYATRQRIKRKVANWAKRYRALSRGGLGGDDPEVCGA